MKGPTIPLGTQRIAAEGSEVVIDVRGNGPVCIAHPGGPGLDSTYLHDKALESGLTVVYIDPLGTGSSGKLPATELYSRERDVRVIEAVRAKLGIDKVCLIGHSYGGFIVLEYAIAHPEHVAGLLLYSTGATTDEAWANQVDANTTWFKNEPWFVDTIKAFGEEAASRKDGAPVMSDEEVTKLGRRMWPIYFADWSGKKAQYAGLIDSLKAWEEPAYRRPKGKANGFDVRHKLGKLHTTPTVVIAGDKDFLFGPEPSKTLAAEIANSKLVVIPGAGHFAHVEQPGAFADAVATFRARLR